ncbi:MAG: Gfo/Idh/MocA family oxidoreductase [Roseburia sp.]|nr:Gfo/Idh/MocA family oxidoreductase [Roseburia sp.]
MKMNIAFAGFRHDHIVGLYHQALQNEMVQIIGCCEEDLSERKYIEENRGIKCSYNRYEEILKDVRIEAVAIGDYFSRRGKMVIEALKHGKHVICDKPICTDIDELGEIERISSEKGLQVACMLDLRYREQVYKGKEIIENGELGEIRIVSFTGQHCLDYENRPKWYFEEGKHGGTINDIAIHGIDIVRFMTGKNLTKINCAKTWNAFADKAPGFKDCGQFMVEMDNISLMGDVSYAAPKCYSPIPTYWNFCFWGTKGMLNFCVQNQNIHVFKVNEEEKIIACKGGNPEYLRDFIWETKGIRTMMNTKEIIESQRQVLKIQKYADAKARG